MGRLDFALALSALYFVSIHVAVVIELFRVNIASADACRRPDYRDSPRGFLFRSRTNLSRIYRRPE